MNDLDWRFLLFGLVGLIAQFMGISLGKSNKRSQHHVAENFLLAAKLIIPYLPFFIIFRLTNMGRHLMAQGNFYAISTVWMAIALFVTGRHGCRKDKEIKNAMFYQFSQMEVIGSIIAMIGVTCYWLKWHSFNP